jgi:hypothetical protein
MLLLCVSSANYILNEIERLSEGTEFYEGKVEAICLPNYDITFNVENITKGGESVEVRSLNVHLTHPDNSIDKIPLIRSEDKWHITIPTYGMEPGPYRFDVAGFAPGRKKIVISSGSLVLDLYNDQGQ